MGLGSAHAASAMVVVKRRFLSLLKCSYGDKVDWCVGSGPRAEMEMPRECFMQGNYKCRPRKDSGLDQWMFWTDSCSNPCKGLHTVIRHRPIGQVLEESARPDDLLARAPLVMPSAFPSRASCRTTSTSSAVSG